MLISKAPFCAALWEIFLCFHSVFSLSVCSPLSSEASWWLSCCWWEWLWFSPEKHLNVSELTASLCWPVFLCAKTNTFCAYFQCYKVRLRRKSLYNLHLRYRIVFSAEYKLNLFGVWSDLLIFQQLLFAVKLQMEKVNNKFTWTDSSSLSTMRKLTLISQPSAPAGLTPAQ